MTSRGAIRLVASLLSLAILAGVGVALYLRYQTPWPRGDVITHRAVDRDRALVVRSAEGSDDPLAAYLILYDRARGPLWAAPLRGLEASSPQSMHLLDGQVRVCAMQGDAPATLRFDLSTGQPAGIEPGECGVRPITVEVPREIIHDGHRYVQSQGGFLFILDARTRHVKAAARVEGQYVERHPVLQEHFVEGRLWVAGDEGVRVIDALTLRPIGGVAIAPPVVDVSDRASQLLPEGF